MHAYAEAYIYICATCASRFAVACHSRSALSARSRYANIRRNAIGHKGFVASIPHAWQVRSSPTQSGCAGRVATKLRLVRAPPCGSAFRSSGSNDRIAYFEQMFEVCSGQRHCIWEGSARRQSAAHGPIADDFNHALTHPCALTVHAPFPALPRRDQCRETSASAKRNRARTHSEGSAHGHDGFPKEKSKGTRRIRDQRA